MAGSRGIAQDSSRPGVPAGLLASLGPAILSLGTPDFPAAFARMAADDLRTDQVVIFRADGPGRIRTLLAQNVLHGAAHALSLAERYTTQHWTKDPNRTLLLPGSHGWSGVLFRAVRVEEIEDRDYRRHLFSEPQLAAKASLVVRAPDHILYVNFYRGESRGPFGPGELEAVGRAGTVLAALVQRHFALVDDRAAGDPGAVQSLVDGAARERGKPLSVRESAVCTRIVTGQSAEGIGLDLGVSQHSVVSYRRRAFQKLGIATQKELFALVLQRVSRR